MPRVIWAGKEQKQLRTEAEIERKKFAENGKFTVRVYPVGSEFIDDAKKLSGQLTKIGGFKGAASSFFATNKVAYTIPPQGVKRSTDKIATILIKPDNINTRGKIPEIEEILKAALSGFEVRRDIAFQVNPTRRGTTNPQSSKIYIYLSNWPIKVAKRTDPKAGKL